MATTYEEAIGSVLEFESTPIELEMFVLRWADGGPPSKVEETHLGTLRLQREPQGLRPVDELAWWQDRRDRVVFQAVGDDTWGLWFSRESLRNCFWRGRCLVLRQNWIYWRLRPLAPLHCRS